MASPGDDAVAHRLDAVDADLAAVEVALDRLDAGTYTTCETCGAPLDPAWRAEHPLDRHCPACPGGT